MLSRAGNCSDLQYFGSEYYLFQGMVGIVEHSLNTLKFLSILGNRLQHYNNFIQSKVSPIKKSKNNLLDRLPKTESKSVGNRIVNYVTSAFGLDEYGDDH